MKGMFFTSLERYISDKYSSDDWEYILGNSELESGDIFISPEIYPDADFMTLVDNAVAYLKVDKEEFLRDFSRLSFHYYAEKYPKIVDTSLRPKEFLLQIQDIHQYEVKKLMNVAEPPVFTYEDPAPNKLIIHYYSKRKLCIVMDGLLQGFSEVYNCPIEYSQSTCMLKGDENCTFEITFLDK